jgi:acetylglutamate kinase
MLRVIDAENLKLVAALGDRDVPAWPITGGVFKASLVDSERLGMVGEVDWVSLESIVAAVLAGQLPIVGCVGATTSGQIVNINADGAASALALSIKPEKIVLLTPTGGLLDQTGSVIPAVNLAEDYERLIREHGVTGGMAVELREIEQLLSGLPGRLRCPSPHPSTWRPSSSPTRAVEHWCTGAKRSTSIRT